ncbi:helix-turn-helix transcriptional regulator [Bifidobacterium sp. ESL0763]|uniref:helix-turn-helix domain-containing protein n=1 Tax=Bifidobacterium sp. ESL0763 TaxID=2983227 RepID=UPI0023F8E9E4|nr:helix-turn-helix transcriptional regulator [Bifidobacterium sp. ESL0763]MDF7663244.1 helix-turn-helix transcriptional regulator [Bifidobacterium sp. ESL0763]
MREHSKNYARLVKQASLLVRNDEKLIDELAEYRKKSGMSVETVADKMGIPADELRDIEGGVGDPAMSVVRRFAHALGLVVSHDVRPYEDFVGGQAKGNPLNEQTIYLLIQQSDNVPELASVQASSGPIASMEAFTKSGGKIHFDSTMSVPSAGSALV